jgi:hypothetical protein
MISDNAFLIPVLFIIFNRPDNTQRVFNAIRKARPARMFVAADGPREDRPGEVEKCQACRAIIDQVDWDCEVCTNFRELNLGIKIGVTSAINWFFQNVENGIILEDDCLPNSSFFIFCQIMLEKYEDDERVMMISGSNCQFGNIRSDGSYYFSRLPGIWGWATWKRAWEYFDPSMNSFPLFKAQKQINNIFESGLLRKYWMDRMSSYYEGLALSWSYAWLYALLTQNGLCICPNKNLVSNIGFTDNATQGRFPDFPFANMETGELDRIIHPSFVIPSPAADFYETKLAREFWSKIIFKERMIKLKSLPIKVLISKLLEKILSKFIL